MASIALLDEHFETKHWVDWQQQGCFSYQLNKQTTDVIEPWRIGVSGVGEQVIESLRFSAEHSLLLKVSWRKVQDITQCNLVWQHADSPLCEADYLVYKNQWQFTHHCKDQTLTRSEDSSHPIHFYPLLRIFSGAMLAALENQATRLLLPDIEMQTRPEKKLFPSLQERHSYLIEKTPNTACYQMLGGHYTRENAKFTLGENAVLTHYTWQQSDSVSWEVTNQIHP